MSTTVVSSGAATVHSRGMRGFTNMSRCEEWCLNVAVRASCWVEGQWPRLVLCQNSVYAQVQNWEHITHTHTHADTSNMTMCEQMEQEPVAMLQPAFGSFLVLQEQTLQKQLAGTDL